MKQQLFLKVSKDFKESYYNALNNYNKKEYNLILDSREVFSSHVNKGNDIAKSYFNDYIYIKENVLHETINNIKNYPNSEKYIYATGKEKINIALTGNDLLKFYSIMEKRYYSISQTGRFILGYFIEKWRNVN